MLKALKSRLLSRESLNSFKTWLKAGLNKWRVAFIVFAVIYAFFLLYNISYMSIKWDEVTHLNGGMFILRGDFHSYFSFNAFYPPISDLITAGFYSILGISLFTGRFVSVVFSLLSLYALFEFGYRNYEPKIALLASILLGIMPGYLWLSRMAMIETLLTFFFILTLLFFFSWIRTHKDKFLILSGLTLGLGILTKYQTIIVGAILLTS